MGKSRATAANYSIHIKDFLYQRCGGNKDWESNVNKGEVPFEIIRDDVVDYLDKFIGTGESKSVAQLRKHALTFLVNQVLELNMDLKNVKASGDKNAKQRPHTAYSKEEVEAMIEYTKSQENLEMECLIRLMYSGAMRIQDAAELTYAQITEVSDDTVQLKGQKT